MFRRWKWSEAAPLGAAMAAAAVRLPYLSAHVFVFDEAIYYMAARSVARYGYAWANMRAIGTAHPPAFFVLMAGWQELIGRAGLSLPVEAVHRLPSVLLAGLTAYLLCGLGARFNREAGWLAALAFALHPFFVAYTRLGGLEALLLFSVALVLRLYLAALDGEGAARAWLFAMTGLALALAALTKVYALVLLAFLCIHRLTVGFTVDRGRRAPGARLRRFSDRLLALDVLTLCLSAAAGLLALSALWAGDPFLIQRIWLTAYGWESGVQQGPLWVFDGLLGHLGFFAFIVAAQGLGVMVYRAVKARRGGEWTLYPILVAGWAVTFVAYSATQFARYLLPLAFSLLLPFGWGLTWIAERLGRRGIIAAALAWICLVYGASLPRVYRALVVDDWWHVDGYRAAAQAIRERGQAPGEFFVTNSHYPILSAYTGMPGGLFTSFTGGRPRVYWIWWGDEATTMVDLTPEMESKLRYVAVVQSYRSLPSDRVLFSRQLSHTWTEGEPALYEYLDDHYRQILFTPDPSGAVTLYERITPAR